MDTIQSIHSYLTFLCQSDLFLDTENYQLWLIIKSFIVITKLCFANNTVNPPPIVGNSYELAANAAFLATVLKVFNSSCQHTAGDSNKNVLVSLFVGEGSPTVVLKMEPVSGHCQNILMLDVR